MIVIAQWTLTVLLLNARTQAGASETPPVDTQRITRSDSEPENWLSVGRTYSEQRFSPLRQINASNVQDLGLAWFYDLNTQRAIQGTPLVVDGIMYATSAWTVTVALDARTGKELWRYDPDVPRSSSRFACCDVVSRGLAVWQGKVLIATFDGRLIALGSLTGKPLWITKTVDTAMWPYTITGAPRVFNGKVVIGNSGSDFGVRGYISAYAVDTGKLLWRFWTVPGDPADGFENAAMQMAAQTWSGRWWVQGGGGAVWDSIVYDPDLNRVYFGTGNGVPRPHKLRSEGKGDNLFLTSIVALDADTGEYVWHYQVIPADNWDYDATQPLVLADLRLGGGRRRVIMQAGKNGFFYVIDRANGKLISAGKFVDHGNFASKIDMATGRPILLPSADYEKGARPIMPSSQGAHSWQPMSYSPLTGLVYFPVLQMWQPYEIAPHYQPNKLGLNLGIADPTNSSSARVWTKYATQNVVGSLLAWDPVRQRQVWRVPFSKGFNGGTLATAGNLVVEGTAEQLLAIYRATDGKLLWEKRVQTAPLAGAMSYMVDGQQYIGICAGGASFDFNGHAKAQPRSDGRILAFKLGANAPLPALADAPAAERPEYPVGAGAGAITEGSKLYHRICAQCHGHDAVSVGSAPDLRYMTSETRDQLKDIVLRGTRSDKGMQSFADQLSGPDVDAILAYLVSRARERL